MSSLPLSPPPPSLNNILRNSTRNLPQNRLHIIPGFVCKPLESTTAHFGVTNRPWNWEENLLESMEALTVITRHPWTLIQIPGVSYNTSWSYRTSLEPIEALTIISKHPWIQLQTSWNQLQHLSCCYKTSLNSTTNPWNQLQYFPELQNIPGVGNQTLWSQFEP